MATVRIIGGKLRGRRVHFTARRQLRPSGDRLRETIFNILQFELHNGAVLDLFAGSGIWGFECHSRGARTVVFVEHHRPTAKKIQQNRDEFSADDIEINCAEAITWLSQNRHRQFDYVFLDPPFLRYNDSQRWHTLLQHIRPVLAPDSMVYCESNFDLSAGLRDEAIAPLSLQRAGKLGDVHWALYRPAHRQ